jgi:predicted RNase H-like HicB family nuclease
MVIHFSWKFLEKTTTIGYRNMKNIKYTFWQDGEFFIGFLNDYPDYETQGFSKDELLENLKSLLKDIESEEIPFIRKVEELVIA